MASSRASILALVTLATVSTARASGGFLPPLEVQYGSAVTAGQDAAAERVVESQLLVGISWASLYPKKTPVDISTGLIATFTPADDPPERSVVARPARTAPADRDALGGYLYLARAIDSRPHFRAWLGARGELMGSGGVGVLGGALRGSFELWSGTMAGDRGSAIVGTVALGLWAEIGIRERADRSVASFAAAGVGVRLPMIVVR